MLSRLFKRSDPRTILFISLSNIGDIILTFPVFDALCDAYPQALFSIVVSAKGKSFFEGHPRVQRIHVLAKHHGLREKVRWLSELRRQKFDLIVDLRNSMLPFLARGRRRTLPVLLGEGQGHMREKHLRRVKQILGTIPLARDRQALYWDQKDDHMVSGLLNGFRDYIVLAPGAADNKKRWPEERFTGLIHSLMAEKSRKIVLVGDHNDAKISEKILASLPGGVLDLCGRTSLKELGLVLKQARLAIVNDSGIMHLASYIDTPVIALFGPTDPRCYGPWGKNGVLVRSSSGRMADLEVNDVIHAVIKAGV